MENHFKKKQICPHFLFYYLLIYCASISNFATFLNLNVV